MSETTPTATYYIRVRGRILGPYDLGQLKVLRSRGQFSRANEVSTDRQVWQSAVTIETLLIGNSRPGSAGTTEPSEGATRLPETSKPARVMAAAWYYSVGEEKLGPVTLLELRGMLAGKQLMPSDLVWKEGLPDWQPVRDVPEINGSALVPRSASASPVPTDAGRADDWNERHVFVDVPGMFGNLRHAGLTAGLPIRTWLTDRPLSLVWVQIVAFMVCFPLALVQYYGGRDVPLEEAAWALCLYFAILGGAILHRCIRPEPISTGRLLGIWFFTSIISTFLVELISEIAAAVPSLREAFTQEKSQFIFYRWLQSTLAVGLIEEACKAIPLIWIVTRSQRPIHPTTVAYLGCISGLAFGSTEGIRYSFRYIFEWDMPAQSIGGYLLIQVLRWISLPLLHAIWAGIFGYFIATAMCFSNARISTCVVALFSVAVLHGTYNWSWGVLPWLPFSIGTASLLLFVGYIRNQLPADLVSYRQSETGEARVNA